MTGLITRGVTGVITATMSPATTHAMTIITRGGIATDITMTVKPTYGARIETVTQINDIAVAGGVRILKTTTAQASCPVRLELIVHLSFTFPKICKNLREVEPAAAE
jgi:hypothetical protein